MAVLADAEIRRLIRQKPPLVEGYLALDTQVQANGFELTLRDVAVIQSAGRIAVDNSQRVISGVSPLVYDGLGDTIRVSLTSDPVEEVKVAYMILNTSGVRPRGIDVISCPTCSRCKVDLIKIVNNLEKRISLLPSVTKRFEKSPIKVAVMGCIVNGPGEAKEADIGIAGGKDTGLLFERGKVIGKVSPDRWVSVIIDRIKKRI